VGLKVPARDGAGAAPGRQALAKHVKQIAFEHNLIIVLKDENLEISALV
jgi:hypothetical protein